MQLHEQKALKSAASAVDLDTDAVGARSAHVGTAIKKNPKIIDADTYNMLAFDQCDGAWPIGHPLPLPMWSNASMAPLIVDKVNIIYFNYDLIYTSPYDYIKNYSFSSNHIIDVAI